jgi:predicted YcjX-like family ATPase
LAPYGITDGIARGLEGVQAGLSGLFFEPRLRLGVTGLARAGKTVFITGLIANLMARGRMPQLRAAAEGRIETVHLQPQPDDTLPRFDYESHLAALTGDAPRWPDSTRSISELRLSFRTRPGGWFAGMRGPQVLHLDIVDYPGEWLLDLGLMDKTYARWSEDVLDRLARRREGAAFLAEARAADGARALDEPEAQALARSFTAYLATAARGGVLRLHPGPVPLARRPGGQPGADLCAAAAPRHPPRGSLWREMDRRFEAYKDRVVTPFFRDHFARIDRQVVLVDVLEALHRGPPAVEDLRRAMADVLGAFRVGQTGWLAGLLGARRVERILFAATKADHLHHEQHPQLAAIAEALLAEARGRAAYAGAEVAAMAIAGLRTTVEEVVERDGERLPAVRGRLLSTGRQAVMYPGALPRDPARVLSPAREGAERWLDADYGLMAFAPARMALAPGEGLPHIRLDRAAEFLIGDRL